MPRHRITRLLVVIGTAIVLAACSGPGTGGPASEPLNPDGALHVVVPSVDSEDADPILFRSAGQHTFLPLIFDTLVGRDVRTGGYGPGLATSWEQAPDGKSWTFHLRDGVTFHDGSPMTAEDVKFTIDRYTGRLGQVAATGSSRIARSISEVEVVDRLTVRIHTPNGSPTLLSDLSSDPGAAAGYVVPKAYVERVGNERFNAEPIGTGPYRLVSRLSGQNMVFNRNDSYWGGRPGTATITLSIVPDVSQRISMLQTGQADIVSGIIGPAIARAQAEPNLSLARAEHGALVYMVLGNGTNPASPLSKVEVRTAINMAIDREGIVKTLLGGYGSAAFLAGWPMSAGFPRNAADYTVPYDPAKAQELLASAGYPNGFPLTLWTSVEGRDFAQVIAQNLQSVGITVSLEVTETAQVTAQMGDENGKRSDRAVLIYGPQGSPSRLDMGAFLTTYLGEGQTNTQPYDNPRLRDMVAAQATINNVEERERVLSEILVTAFEEKVGIQPLWYVDTLFAQGPRVAGWTVIPGMAYPQNLQSVIVTDRQG